MYLDLPSYLAVECVSDRQWNYLGNCFMNQIQKQQKRGDITVYFPFSFLLPLLMDNSYEEESL